MDPAAGFNAVAAICAASPEALVEDAVFTMLNQAYEKRQQTSPG
jgi:hypothetical protein